MQFPGRYVQDCTLFPADPRFFIQVVTHRLPDSRYMINGEDVKVKMAHLNNVVLKLYELQDNDLVPIAFEDGVFDA